MKLLACCVALACACFFAEPACATSGEQRGEKLNILKGQIKALQDDIAKGEESHEEVADHLSVVDRAVSDAQRKIKEIVVEREKVERELQALLRRQRELDDQIQQAKKSLGDTVFRLYVEGGQAGTRRLLSSDEPNQLARDAYYMEQIARQRVGVIEQSRAALQELQGVLGQVKARRAELVALERAHAAGQQNLVAERKRQKEALGKISDQLRTQKKQMQNLKRDEARMEKLLKGLEKISQAHAASVQKDKIVANVQQPASAVERPQNVRGKRPNSATVTTTTSSNTASSSAPTTTEAAKADSSPVESGEAAGVAALKGHLRWPVKGAVLGRFGAPRAEGGAVWRGVFIKAALGQDVHSVAAGKVAFADWLRGFGNLVIVDHGDGYMTVYGNNESLYKSPGDDVRAGEVIASVGASGGQDDSGLYFELRYRGQALDPAKWVAPK